MLNINLVPEVKKEQAKLKQLNLTVSTIAFVVGGVVVAAILILGSLLAYRTAATSSLKTKIAAKEGELKAYKDLEDSVITLENGLADIKQITSGGRNWTDFFEEVEKATPGDIQFSSFKVSGNIITADIKGKDVKSIDRFLKSFTNYKDAGGNNMFSGVAVDGYTAKDGGGVTFQAKLTVAEAKQ